jgi:hypothetical protein
LRAGQAATAGRGAAAGLVAAALVTGWREKTMAKLLYKLTGMLAGMLASMIAGRIFRRVWTLIRPQDDTPKATDAWRGWGEVLLAAILQGAIFALAKAAADHGAAEGTRRLTGVWPGDESQQSGTPD